jgi:hypothetical protein
MCKKIGRERQVSGTEAIAGNELPSDSGLHCICHAQLESDLARSSGNSQSGLSSHGWREETI